MSTIKVEVEVSKETYELGQGLAAMTKAVKTALADGWQPGQDIPAVVMAAFNQMAAIEGIDKIDDEAKENQAAFAKAIALGLADSYDSYKGEAAQA